MDYVQTQPVDRTSQQVCAKGVFKKSPEQIPNRWISIMEMPDRKIRVSKWKDLYLRKIEKNDILILPVGFLQGSDQVVEICFNTPHSSGGQTEGVDSYPYGHSWIRIGSAGLRFSRRRIFRQPGKCVLKL